MSRQSSSSSSSSPHTGARRWIYPSARIYIAECAEGKWYVGRTERPHDGRFKEHLQGEGKGAEWTKAYPPIPGKIAFSDEKSPFDEQNCTIALMTLYGMDHVRGGAFCNVNLSNGEREFITRLIQSVARACYVCNQVGHTAIRCPHNKK